MANDKSNDQPKSAQARDGLRARSRARTGRKQRNGCGTARKRTGTHERNIVLLRLERIGAELQSVFERMRLAETRELKLALARDAAPKVSELWKTMDEVVNSFPKAERAEALGIAVPGVRKIFAEFLEFSGLIIGANDIPAGRA